jgi:hypothetical protein
MFLHYRFPVLMGSIEFFNKLRDHLIIKNMRTKRVTMALLAFSIAISCAFTSKLPFPKMAWVRVETLGNPGYTCLPTFLMCDNFGELTCYVSVLTEVGIVSTSGRGMNNCNLVLSSSTGSSIGTYYPSIPGVIGAGE